MRKVLIFSTIADVTTGKVMAWIHHLDSSIKVIRINDTELERIPTVSINNNKIIFTLKGENTNVDSILKIWYRNGTLFRHTFFTNSRQTNLIIESEFQQYLDYIGYFLWTKTKCIGSVLNEKYLNKLIVLDKAREVGLNIPKIFLSNNGKPPIKPFNFIAKSIGNIPPFIIEDWTYYTKYEKLSENDIEFPSFYFVQEYIEKQFEVRSFFFMGNIWSMAIFSQQSSKTNIDYRNYDQNCPNRIVPFVLPKDINEKLLDLMNKLDLNTGSIDLIVTNKFEFYFLEVNPCGQIDWVSENCNYYLEKTIAKYLIE